MQRLASHREGWNAGFSKVKASKKEKDLHASFPVSPRQPPRVTDLATASYGSFDELFTFAGDTTTTRDHHHLRIQRVSRDMI